MAYLANLRLGSSCPIFLEVPVKGMSIRKGKAALVEASWQLGLTAIPEAPGFKVIIDERKPYEKQDGPILFPKSSLREEIAIFDFDAKLPKKAAPITGKADLEPDGSNLAIVLRNILQSEERRKQLTLLLRDLLPFVADLKVERFADKSLLISLKESFSQESYLPASFLSDGTIHLTALILVLYFDKAPVVIIEEPERNIHPHLISKVAAMLVDASKKKQVIVTTHNPELVKHTRLEDLLLVHRDAEGFSRISRPVESAELKIFLENDLGVEELYVQDLLGVGE
jgi:hypothetical protein